MKQLIVDTATWPAGARLAVFFFVPTVVVLQLLRLLADLPLYLEYHVTTALRSRFGVAAPPIVGDIGAVIAAAGRTTRTATKIVLGLALVVAIVSIGGVNVAKSGDQNQALKSFSELIDHWWTTVSARAGVGA